MSNKRRVYIRFTSGKTLVIDGEATLDSDEGILYIYGDGVETVAIIENIDYYTISKIPND